MKVIVLIFCSILLFSCEKNIHFNLKIVPAVIVVDANIENGQRPVVILSKSFNYFSKITAADLDTSFVHNAEISLSNGTKTQKLIEYSLDSVGYRFYFYSIDTANISEAFLGEINTTYHLKINTAGQEYDATTTIPSLAEKIDSLWSKPTPFASDTTEADVYVQLTDPPGLGNYGRYYTQINNGPFLPGIQSVFDDELIDGTTYDIKITPGVDRNNPIAFDKNYFHKGDTVTLKISNIDRNTYQFWLTMEFAYQSIGNPFASPNTVLGNISNGGLGAFCGYASATKTIYIPQ
ncbi:MAG: DUF4249 domain-containing protein [Ginsengibacter sp.]